MIRSLASVSLSGPATQALERSVKRCRVSNEKEEEEVTSSSSFVDALERSVKRRRVSNENENEDVTSSFSLVDVFDSLSQEVSDEESFPVIAWDFDD